VILSIDKYRLLTVSRDCIKWLHSNRTPVRLKVDLAGNQHEQCSRICIKYLTLCVSARLVSSLRV